MVRAMATGEIESVGKRRAELVAPNMQVTRRRGVLELMTEREWRR